MSSNKRNDSWPNWPPFLQKLAGGREISGLNAYE